MIVRAEDTHVAHIVFADPSSEVKIEPGGTVSKGIVDDNGLKAIVVGFDTGEGTPEHDVPLAAIVQVLSGLLHYNVQGEEFDLAPGSWLYLPPGTPHAQTALEPTVLLLTLVPPKSD